MSEMPTSNLDATPERDAPGGAHAERDAPGGAHAERDDASATSTAGTPTVPLGQPDTHVAAVHDADDASVTSVLTHDDAKESATQRMPMPTRPRDAGTTRVQGAPTIVDVMHTLGDYARGRRAGMTDLLARRPVLTAVVAGVAVLGILVGVLAGMRAADLPALEAVESDVRTQLVAPAYAPGTFANANALAVHGLTVTGRSRVGDDDAVATAHVTWVNDDVAATAEATLSYRRDDGGWAFTGGEIADAAFVARHGVDARMLAADSDGLAAVLAKAESAWEAQAGGGDAAGTSLATLYQHADATVVSDAFDEAAQTDVVTLHLVSTGTFTALEADVRADFAFRPATGAWELTGARAARGAKDVAYTPLEGTWNATFTGTEALGHGRCFGAEGGEAHLVIDEASAGRITGTIAATAHFHGELAANAASSAGDVMLSAPFVGSREQDADGISFACTVETTDGSCDLRLAFGLPDDPDAASAHLTTTYATQERFLLFPYTRETTFTDTYLLRRAQ